MPELTDKIREAARNLLQQEEVELVIGFAQGSMPLRSTPCFVRKTEEVDRLIWDSFCENSLAKYLVKRPDRVAVVAKGCDTRAIVELIKENQILREQVVIIGVPCQGMADRRRIETGLGDKKVLEIAEEDSGVILGGADFRESLNRDEFLYPSCRICTHKNPVIYDLLVGSKVTEQVAEPYLEVERLEAGTVEERWEHTARELSKCVRCYACRNVCPLCYCQKCFVDSPQSQWIGKTTDPSSTVIFHIMRAYHLAGRCVECGACERACPMGVDIQGLNRKLARDLKDLFGYQAGISLEQTAPLTIFKPDSSLELMLNR